MHPNGMNLIPVFLVIEFMDFHVLIYILLIIHDDIIARACTQSVSFMSRDRTVAGRCGQGICCGNVIH